MTGQRPRMHVMRRRVHAALLSLAAAIGLLVSSSAIFGRGRRDNSKTEAEALHSNISRYCAAGPQTGTEGRIAPGSASVIDGAELVHVLVLVRHGARSAIHSIPGGAHNFSCALSPEVQAAVASWPSLFEVHSASGGHRVSRQWMPETEDDGITCKTGQLNNAGYRQLLSLGNHLASAYAVGAPNFLAGLQPKEVYIRATDFTRTRASAAALVTGLLGLGRSRTPEHDRFTVNVHESGAGEVMHGAGWSHSSRQTNEANVQTGSRHPSSGDIPCAKATNLAQVQEAVFAPTHGVGTSLAHLFGPAAKHLRSVQAADAVYSTVCDRGQLPCGPNGCIDSELAQLIVSDADRHFCGRFAGQQGGAAATRLAFWPLLNEVLQHLHSGASGAGARLAILAGHDTVVAPLAAALGFYDCRWPPFASRIVFELWRLPVVETEMVRVLWDGRPVTQLIKECRTELCPLDRFAVAINGLLDGHTSFQAACSP